MQKHSAPPGPVFHVVRALFWALLSAAILTAGGMVLVRLVIGWGR